MTYQNKIYYDYPDIRYYLGCYATHLGVGTLLVSIEPGVNLETMDWETTYHLTRAYYAPQTIPVGESVTHTLELITGLSPGSVVVYANAVNHFFNALRVRGGEAIADYWKTTIEPVEAFQIVTDLLTDSRLTTDPGPGEILTPLLRNFRLDDPDPDPLIYALFHSVGVMERNRLRQPLETPLEIFTI
jgi:hypothetical protein